MRTRKQHRQKKAAPHFSFGMCDNMVKFKDVDVYSSARIFVVVGASYMRDVDDVYEGMRRRSGILFFVLLAFDQCGSKPRVMRLLYMYDEGPFAVCMYSC